jgi:hypothetical protein
LKGGGGDNKEEPSYLDALEKVTVLVHSLDAKGVVDRAHLQTKTKPCPSRKVVSC